MESGCYLCDDLLRDILLRLPTKSLLRFKSVSKSWCSLITDPCFLNKSPKFIIKKQFKDEALFSLDLLCSSSGNLEKLSLPVELDIKTSNLILVGSCNGLLLLRAFRDTPLRILNVSTREFHTIHIPNFRSSESNRYFEQRCFGFGYDFVNDDYKVIKVFSYEEDRNEPIQGTSVYSLRNNAWRTNRARKGLGALVPLTRAVFVGGKLHWISKPDHKGERCILAFDLSSEDFHEIAALPKVEDVNSYFGFLSEVEACLTVTELSPDPPFPVAIWVLKESGWVQVLRTCDWSPFETMNGKYRCLVPLAYSETGNEVLITDFYSCFWYNQENGKLDTFFSGKDSVSITKSLDTLVSIGAYTSHDEENQEKRRGICLNFPLSYLDHVLNFQLACFFQGLLDSFSL